MCKICISISIFSRFFRTEEEAILLLLPLLITECSHAFTATRPSSSTVHICRLGKGEGRHYVGRLPLHFSHFSAICNFSSSCCCPTCKITFFFLFTAALLNIHNSSNDPKITEVVKVRYMTSQGLGTFSKHN